jgi:hypothetical protein
MNDCIKCGEHFEKFEIEHNALPTVGLPMLHNRFFGQADDIIKRYLTPIMLGKQRLQMNQSLCYDIKRVMDWQQLLEVSRQFSNHFFFLYLALRLNIDFFL